MAITGTTTTAMPATVATSTATRVTTTARTATRITTTLARRGMVADPIITERAPGLELARRGMFGRKTLVGGEDILGRRLRREFALNTESGETARFCLRGKRGHALVCLDDRLLILKRGFRAGASFGAMAATIFYRDVTGIQVRMHVVSGWIEISTPSFQGAERPQTRRSRSAAASGVVSQPNCVPVHRRHVALYQVALAELRHLIAAAKLEHDHRGVVTQLERLASLRRQGVVDEREFSAAKSTILESALEGAIAPPQSG
jgi:hypothetical protein